MRITRNTKIRIRIRESIVVQSTDGARHVAAARFWRAWVQRLIVRVGFGKLILDPGEAELTPKGALIKVSEESSDARLQALVQVCIAALAEDLGKEGSVLALVIEAREYAAYIKVAGGEGDGQLIYMDAQGQIHIVNGGDASPRPQVELETALGRIKAAIDEVRRTIGKIPQKKV